MLVSPRALAKQLIQTPLLAALECASVAALSHSPAPVGNGELLYTTHCKQCQP